jgi:5-methylcytosine-specific restriction endonuclease McrA
MEAIKKTSEYRLQKERERYVEKKDHIAEVTKAYRERNRELLKEKARQYRIDNKEKIKEVKRENYLRTKDACNERSQRYYEENRERMLEVNKAWCDRNPERAAAIRANRRKKIKEAGEGLSSNIVQKLMKLQRGKCACCGTSLKNGFHVDHILPLALGGEHSDLNVQLLTPRCNLKKKALHPVDWMQKQGRLL